MARERKDVSCLHSGVPLLFMETKQKEMENKGNGGWEHEGEEERRGIKGGTEGKKKFEPVLDNNVVCFVTET